MFKIYGNKTVNKQQFNEQKSLSALIPQPQLNVLIVSLAYILSLTLHSHIYLQIGLFISAIIKMTSLSVPAAITRTLHASRFFFP